MTLRLRAFDSSRVTNFDRIATMLKDRLVIASLKTVPCWRITERGGGFIWALVQRRLKIIRTTLNNHCASDENGRWL
jgi:hypothetical protein